MGYVGLPTALGLHAAGAHVLGIDHDPRRLAAIRDRGVDLTPPDRLLLDAALDGGDFELTADVSRLSEASAVMVCVPTPVDRYLLPDLEPLRAACETVVRHAQPSQVLILTSTSFVGTTAKLLVEPLTARGFTPGRDIFVVSSPERIDPGNLTHTLSRTPRVLGGVTAACAAAGTGIIRLITPSVHPVSSPQAAEMTKLLENSFRAVNIALANEFAEICAGLDLDPIEVVDAAASKPYGFMAFQPGPGVGGHCIPCDPHYLLWQLRESRSGAPLLNQAMLAIAERPARVVDRVLETLSRVGKGLAGTRIVVVGVTYKPGVQDVRSSSAVEILSLLIERGAKVGYYDPLAPQVTLGNGAGVEGVAQPHGADWDLALIHTVQPGYDYGWVGSCPIVVDATYRFEAAAA